MLERYVSKKLPDISSDCYVMVRHALHLHLDPNHILIYFLNRKIKVLLCIAVGN